MFWKFVFNIHIYRVYLIQIKSSAFQRNEKNVGKTVYHFYQISCCFDVFKTYKK